MVDFKKLSEKVDARKAANALAAPPTHPFLLGVTRFLLQLGKTKETEFKTKNNVDARLANAFLWDFVASFAKARADGAWKELETEGIIESDGDFKQGDHELVRSPSFVCKLSVTAPVRRFSPEALAEILMVSKYKVPKHVSIKLMEDAKKPTKGQHRYSIEIV